MIPQDCALWSKEPLFPEDLYDLFDEVKVFHQNPHSSKRLLRCKECGQLYIYEFTGSGNPNDSSLEILYIPVKQAGDTLEASTSGIPHIKVTWPAHQEQPTAFWVRT